MRSSATADRRDRQGLRHRALRFGAALTLLPGLGLLTIGAPAQAQSTPRVRVDSAAATRGDDVTTTGTSAYTCFVTFPGGTTNVNYSLTYTATAPATVAPHGLFTVTFPVITPDPTINEQVQSVRAAFELPGNAVLYTAALSGRSGITGPTSAVLVEAQGPLKGAAAAVSTGFIDATALIGPAERIAERLLEYAEAGVTTLSLMVSSAAARTEERLETLHTIAEAWDKYR
jgi:hypothetical protein